MPPRLETTSPKRRPAGLSALTGERTSQALLIVATCGAYLLASSLLILLNKHLLSNDGFPFPLMLSGSGMLMSNLGSSLLVRWDRIVPNRQVRAAC